MAELICPSLFKINESDLERVFGIDEEKRPYIPLIDGLTKFTENNQIPLFQPVNFGDKLQILDDLSKAVVFLTDMQQLLKKKESDTCFNSDVHKAFELNNTKRKSDFFVYRNVEFLLKTMLDVCQEHPDNAFYQFSISSFRKQMGLNKGKEAEIKESFRKIGIHSDDKRTKFECPSVLKTNTCNPLFYFIR